MIRTTILVTLAVGVLFADVLPASAQLGCTIFESFDSGFDAPWQVSDPAFVQPNGGVLQIQFTGISSDVNYATSENCIYQDFIMDADLRDRDGAGSVVIGFRTSGIERRGYSVNLRSSLQDITLAKGIIGLRDPLVSVPITHNTNQWRHIKIIGLGSMIQVYLDGLLVINYVDPAPLSSGWIDLAINAGGNGVAFAEYDNVHIEDLFAVETETSSWGSLRARY